MSHPVDAGNPPDSADPTDAAGRVREEDAFDVEAMAVWLRAHAPERLRPALAGLPEVTQFPGGASNLTYRLRYLQTDPAIDLVLRRPPAGAKARSAHDMAREFRIQAALAEVFDQVAPMVAHCDDPGVIGSEFYVMQRVAGVIPRRDFPVAVTAEQADTLCRRAWDTLIDLHSIDVSVVPDLAALGRGDGYVARQVAGWTDRLAHAATPDLGDWAAITDWLDRERPADAGQCLIHNDYRFDNLVLDPADPTRILAVLDWEMATVGDPLMDLGGALAYWVEPGDDETFQLFRRQPTNAPGMWRRDQVVAHYAAATGLSLTPERWRFYEVFGLFRLAVIAQQIWYRYYHRQTTNPAYAVFGPAVSYLEQRCRRILGLPGSA